MTKQIRLEKEGGALAPRGFRAAGVFCDVRELGSGGKAEPKRDLAILFSETGATAAGMFTANRVKAAPVRLCLERIGRGSARAIVVNSGNANACTGEQGDRDAAQMAAWCAEALEVDPGEVLVASTGRIGAPLPMSRIRNGIFQAASLLGDSPQHAAAAAEAIMTTDTRPKQVAVSFRLGGRRVRLGGMAKGAGMIHPGMSRDGREPPPRGGRLHATMLAFLTADAAVAPDVLQQLLEEAVAGSFNCVTVDGDMSTNDTVLALSNGLAGNPPIEKIDSAEAALFGEALRCVCLELAKMIVRDGEGRHRVVAVRVEGASDDEEADRAARAIANSVLVKTSWHGGDPNWGRIMDALGYSGARIEPSLTDVGYSAPESRRILWAARGGEGTDTPFKRLCEIAALEEFDLHVRLNLGSGRAVIYATDLTENYVTLNKGEPGKPESLGG